MKPILINCPMPITTPRLLIRPPLPGDGKMLNEAVLESFETLQRTLAWATNKPTVDESEEVARQAAANWILKKDEEPYLPLFIFDRESNHFIGATGFHHID
jgi:ribosomal-protein-serine acetyltransferase